MTQTEWQVRAEKEPEYNEIMWLRWYYSHMQAYVNRHIPFEHKDYDTFQEWIIDYYEHPEWGSNYKLKAPESYRENAQKKAYANHGTGYDKITEDDK